MKYDFILRWDWMNYDREFENKINFWGDEMEGPWLSLRMRFYENIGYKIWVLLLYAKKKIIKMLKKMILKLG
jgi:hypothetical protein